MGWLGEQLGSTNFVGWLSSEGSGRWVIVYLATSSKWSTAGVCLGPVPFNAIINDLEKVTECTLVQYADDSKLVGSADTLKSRAAIQRNHGGLQERADRNLVKSNNNCKVLHVGGNNPCNDTVCRLACWRAALLKSTWGSWWTEGCIGASSGPWHQGRPTVSWALWTEAWPVDWRKDYPPLLITFCTACRYCALFWSSQQKEDINKPEQVWWRATKIVRGWSTCPVREVWGNGVCSAWREPNMLKELADLKDTKKRQSTIISSWQFLL